MAMPRVRGLLSVALVLLLSVQRDIQAAPIDEFRISDIEQQIRDLRSQLNEQSRLIAQQQQRNGSPSTISPASASSRSIIIGTEARWLSATAWQRLQPGMNELTVIELLGPPNQLRSDTPGEKQLLYALEIGRSGFLSGKVVLVNGQLQRVESPVLR